MHTPHPHASAHPRTHAQPHATSTHTHTHIHTHTHTYTHIHTHTHIRSVGPGGAGSDRLHLRAVHKRQRLPRGSAPAGQVGRGGVAAWQRVPGAAGLLAGWRGMIGMRHGWMWRGLGEFVKWTRCVRLRARVNSYGQAVLRLSGKRFPPCALSCNNPTPPHLKDPIHGPTTPTHGPTAP